MRVKGDMRKRKDRDKKEHKGTVETNGQERRWSKGRGWIELVESQKLQTCLAKVTLTGL